MKPKMMSKDAMDQLFYHILDGFKSSYEGIYNLYDQKIITAAELAELLQKNSERLITRIHEFKVGQKMLCVVFALLFGYLQIAGDDLEMRRGRRGGRAGRRKGESEMPLNL